MPDILLALLIIIIIIIIIIRGISDILWRMAASGNHGDCDNGGDGEDDEADYDDEHNGDDERSGDPPMACRFLFHRIRFPFVVSSSTDWAECATSRVAHDEPPNGGKSEERIKGRKKYEKEKKNEHPTRPDKSGTPAVGSSCQRERKKLKKKQKKTKGERDCRP